jgi:carboxypeptidase family protein
MVRVASLLVAVFLVAGGAAAQPVVLPPPPPPPLTGPGAMPQIPPRDNTAKTGTARIRGHVFDAETGSPIRKAQVRAFSPELRENRMTMTDASGSFELKEMPAGRYNLSASKGSYVMLQYGQRRPFEAGRPLEILNAQTIEKVDFSLPRGSVITGRVADEFGETASDVQVMAMRYQFFQGRRRLTPAGRPSMTNDIGEYRIYGLPPGQYYLSATLRGMAMMDAQTDDRSGYAPTYFPGTPNVAEAQRITVALGQVLSDLNLSLMPTRTARVSGTAVDSTGKPLAGGFIMVIQRTGPMFMASGGSQIRPDGSFVLSSIAPGEYTLQAQMPGGFGEMGESASAPITVTGDDLTGVQLVGVKPSAATGRIVVNPAEAAGLQPSSLRLSLMPAKPDDTPMMMGPGGGGKVNDDFTFELKSRPGVQLVRLNPIGGNTGWTMRAVRHNGVEVTDTGIEFKANEDMSGIEIELTNKPSEVSGVVTNARGEMLKDYTVVIFAQDSQRWGSTSRYQGTGRPDQDGRFKVRSLPPGQYCVIALDYVEPGESSDPEFLERIRVKATTFSLSEGETKNMDLRLSTGS